MAKLDWGKASLRELDPARVQRAADFTTPDPVVVKKGKKPKRAYPNPPRPSHTVAFEAAARGYLLMITRGQSEADADLKIAKRRNIKKTVAKPQSKPVPKAKREAQPSALATPTNPKKEARRLAKRAARMHHRASLKQVIVEHRADGKITSAHKLGEPKPAS